MRHFLREIALDCLMLAVLALLCAAIMAGLSRG